MTPDEFRTMIRTAHERLGTDFDVAVMLLVSERQVRDWRHGAGTVPPPAHRATIRRRLEGVGVIGRTERTPRDVVTERERNAETLECMLAAVAGGSLVAAGLLIAWVVTS